MAFDLEKLRIERINTEISYHATYTFYGLKGVLAERWAHGPIFGAVGELGTAQLNLTPQSGENLDERLVAVVGLRACALLAEGPRWTQDARPIAREWFEDVYTVLKPQRTVTVRTEVLALYPIRDPYAATRHLVSGYYQDDKLTAFTGSERYLAAVETFSPDENPQKTLIMGVIGPPHRNQFFTFPDPQRDEHWWMGLRFNYGVVDEDGIADPLAGLATELEQVFSDLNRLARSALPSLVS
jgi:hypothetical protein